MLSIATYTGGIAATNAHLLTLPGGTFLVDAPEGVADWLKSRGAQVDALLLTHQHFDHVLDAAAVIKQHGCRTYAWSPFSRMLTLEALFGAVTGSSLAVPEFGVDEILEGKPALNLGGQQWRLHHIPGHSPDSVCFHLEDSKVLFGGDVLFHDSIGRTDFPGGSFEQLTAGIRTHLWPLPPETRVLPGHGPETTVGREKRQNPFIGAADN
jgi:glyoxylase-like metal-dependent hydrolase (beta-lactamase superfamily II)